MFLSPWSSLFDRASDDHFSNREIRLLCFFHIELGRTDIGKTCKKESLKVLATTFKQTSTGIIIIELEKKIRRGLLQEGDNKMAE